MIDPKFVVDQCSAEFAAGRASRDAEVAALRAEVASLKNRRKTYRKALRDLNRAHNVLWRVLQIAYDRRAKEARDAARRGGER